MKTGISTMALCWLAFAVIGFLLPSVGTAAAKTDTTPNAATYYLRAANLRKRLPSSNSNKPLTLEQRRKFVNDNVQALSVLREGFKYSFHTTRTSLTDEDGFSLIKGTLLASLLLREADVRYSDGDVISALSSLCDAMRLGTDMSDLGIIYDYRYAALTQGVAQERAWTYISTLKEQDPEKLLHPLRSLLSKSENDHYVQVLKAEKTYVITYMMNAFRTQQWRSQLKDTAEFENNTQLLTLLKSKTEQQIIDNMATYYDQLINIAQQPYPIAKSMESHVETPLLLSGILDPMSLMLKHDAVDQFRILTEKHRVMDIRVDLYHEAMLRTHYALLLTTIAIESYKKKQGKYPETLHDLLPQYLTEVPRDPFAKSGTLKYLLTPTGYTLYSVGPDGIDDNGKAVTEEDGSHDVSPQSVGDIVAGINQSYEPK